MKGSDKRHEKEKAACPDGAARDLPRDIDLLLTEIEKEPVPERLMALAVELQQALARRRAVSGR